MDSNEEEGQVAPNRVLEDIVADIFNANLPAIFLYQ
jgi:hypothetical protein